MPYITMEDYRNLYGNMDEMIFNRLVVDACRVLDIHTTGIDNVKKLKNYFPTDEEDATLVKHCACKIVNTLHQIQQAEATALAGRGYEATAQGVRGKVISSISAGNESISYATANNEATAYDAAAKDKTVRDRLLAEIVWEYLAGISDSNGVGLLYMGKYPRRR